MEINFPSDEQIQAKLRARKQARSGAITTPIEAPDAHDDSPKHHCLFHSILAIVEQREHAYLVGPAGSGKSKCAEDVAAHLGLPYSAPPIGRETSIAQLFGYFNAAGEYVRTPIRERAENGGVLHLEEIDFASPAVGTALNALLANDYIGFPDIAVKRHADFVCIASANTYGTGANAQYIGSQGLNAATLDRFTFIDFPYDIKLELAIAPNKQWTQHVINTRAQVEKLGLKHVVSPRASIKGGKLINSKKFTWEQVEKMVLFRGLDPVTVNKIKTTVTA